jgi:hypothetical protein
MRHALLVNPFNLNAGPRPTAGPTAGPAASPRDTRFTPVCSHCQSDDLVCHAIAQWSNRSQQWELANTFDQPVHCNSCDSPCTVAWQPLNWR